MYDNSGRIAHTSCTYMYHLTELINYECYELEPCNCPTLKIFRYAHVMDCLGAAHERKPPEWIFVSFTLI